MLTSSSGGAGEEDAVPGVRERVAHLKPGHFQKGDVSPQLVLVLPAAHHLWMEVGGRGEQEEEDRRDESEKAGQTPALPAASQVRKELPGATRGIPSASSAHCCSALVETHPARELSTFQGRQDRLLPGPPPASLHTHRN